MERDESEFARLSQLGDVLGLTMFDVKSVHDALTEQAFRQQVPALALRLTLQCVQHSCCCLSNSAKCCKY